MISKPKAGPAGSAFITFLLIISCLLCALPCEGKGRLRVAFVGDPQVDNETELAYARASVFAELKGRRDLDLVVVLGDLVNENASLMRPCVESLDSLPCPWVCVRGNHDNPAGTFAELVCPRDTSFVMGGVRFICIDDIDGWKGELPDDGWNVVCAHIPFSYGAPADSLAAVLASKGRMLLVSGHTHQVLRHRIGGVEEVIAGASCGSWWRGVKGNDGVPYALMNCGAPRGYFVADFRPGKEDWYSLSYKAVGRGDEASAQLNADSTAVLVNVFGGAVDGSVSIRYKGSRGWVEASREEAIAPEVQAVIDWNYSHDRAYRRAHKEEFIPMRRLKSPHLWSAPVPPAGISATVPTTEESGGRTDFMSAEVSGGRTAGISAAVPTAGTKVTIRYSDPTMSFTRKVTLR